MSDEKADVWMPFFVGDYLASTMNLTRDQHGGYLLLLFAMWKGGGELVDDDGDLAAIVKATPAEWRKLRPKLERFFTIANGVWTKGRVTKDLDAAQQRKAKAIAKAASAAAARWGHPVDNYASSSPPSNAPSMPQAMPGGMLEQCPPSSSLIHNVLNASNTARATAETSTPGDKDRPQKQVNGSGAWRRDPDSAAAKGREIGLSARPGETTEQFVHRIDETIELRGREARP